MTPFPDPTFWLGRRVAVTGATGFVGLHVVQELRRLGAEVIAVVRAASKRARLLEARAVCVEAELDQAEALTRAMAGCEFVFHLAGAVDFGDDWARYRRVNVEGTRQVLAAARRAKVKRVIHTSSIVAVGAGREPRILDETASWNLGAERAPYATTKREAESLARSAARDGQDVVIVNPACVIGPNDYTGSEFGTLCKRFWRRSIPFHFGGGLNLVDVRDVAQGALLAAERGKSGERYILCGENRTTGDFYADLAAAAGKRYFFTRLPAGVGWGIAQIVSSLNWGKRRPVLTIPQLRLSRLFFFFDCRKAREELGFSPRPLPQTLADTHAWWCGNASGSGRRKSTRSRRL